jgi:hypothetical protein
MLYKFNTPVFLDPARVAETFFVVFDCQTSGDTLGIGHVDSG